MSKVLSAFTLPKRIPTTRFTLWVLLTRLKWSTTLSKTSGWTTTYKVVNLKCIPNKTNLFDRQVHVNWASTMNVFRRYFCAFLIGFGRLCFGWPSSFVLLRCHFQKQTLTELNKTLLLSPKMQTKKRLLIFRRERNFNLLFQNRLFCSFIVVRLGEYEYTNFVRIPNGYSYSNIHSRSRLRFAQNSCIYTFVFCSTILTVVFV